MNPPTTMPAFTVSNLVPDWEEETTRAVTDSAVEPTRAAAHVGAVVRQAERPPVPAAQPRMIAPPSAFSYELLHEQPDAEPVGAELPTMVVGEVDYDALRRRDIARELLRARLVALAEQREHRSAYEIVFIMLAAAVAVLLAAPPLVQVLLAANGVQA